MVNNTILLRKDKSLVKTIFRRFYQKEHYTDKIQFLVDTDFMNDDITSYTITLFVTLPKPDEITGENVTNCAKYLSLDEELYKGKYRIELPITITLTENVGDVVMWLQFSKQEEDGSVTLCKTESTFISIISSGQGSNTELEESESYDVLTQLQQDVNELKENKMDKYYEYNASTGELQLYANGEAVDEINVDQEIKLINW